MAKQQKNEVDNLYNFSNNVLDNEKENRQKAKEREKRIRQRNIEQKDKFDLDTETVIGMTNKNNQQRKQEERKRISKKQAQILKRKKRIKKIIKLTTLFLLIIGGVVFALVSPIFDIRDIIVSNNKQISEDTIISLSQLQIGQNLFRFNSNKIKKQLKTNPYIESVEVKRKIPNQVEIIIEERDKNYNVEFLNGYAYINNQGYILEISEQKVDAPILRGVSTEPEQIVEGNRLNTQDLNRLEAVIQIVNICKNYELDKKISIIDITDKSNYSIYMEEERKTIYLGDGSNLNNKMLYLPTVLQENQKKEGEIYIDKDNGNKFKAIFREKV